MDLKVILKKEQRMLVFFLVAALLLFLTLISLLVAVGCEAQQRPVEQKIIADVRGYLYYGEGVNAFRDCDGEEEFLVVTDNLNIDLWQTYSDLAPDYYFPVYVEMRVRILVNEQEDLGGDYAGGIIIEELYHMAYETRGCQADKDYKFFLNGTEPFWDITIDEQSGVFLRVLGEEEVYAPYVPANREGDSIEYMLMSGSSPITIKLRKVDTFCSMSGAYFAYSAFVSFKDHSYYGQGMPGEQFLLVDSQLRL